MSTPTTACLGAFHEAYFSWRKTVEAELKGVSFEKKLVTRTAEGIALHPLYTRADLEGLPYLDAAPGEAPYLRGTRPLGYKTARWEVAQEISAADPVEFNRALLADLMGGQDSVTVAIAGDGLSGLAIDQLGGLETALAGVELGVLPVHLRAAVKITPLAGHYLALAKARGVAAAKLSGSVTADPLASWVRNGRVEGGLDAAINAVVDWSVAAATAAPRLRTVGIDATVWADAAGTSTQELAFALSAAAEYLRAFASRGISVSEVAPRLRFSFAVGPQFFTEVAKLRAFRPLLTRVLVAFGASPTAAGQVAVHATTGRWNKTLLDAHVNMLRITTEALSAVLGGVDSLHLSPYDELTGASDPTSRRIARNVHTLLAEEFGFTQTADPTGGSYYIEKLTDELGRKTWAIFQDIETRAVSSPRSRPVTRRIWCNTAPPISPPPSPAAVSVSWAQISSPILKKSPLPPCPPGPPRPLAPLRSPRCPPAALRLRSRRCASPPTPSPGEPAHGPRCFSPGWDLSSSTSPALISRRASLLSEVSSRWANSPSTPPRPQLRPPRLPVPPSPSSAPRMKPIPCLPPFSRAR